MMLTCGALSDAGPFEIAQDDDPGVLKPRYMDGMIQLRISYTTVGIRKVIGNVIEHWSPAIAKRPDWSKFPRIRLPTLSMTR